MFPAWTYHSVEMNMEDRDRISIAFNLIDPQSDANAAKDSYGQ